MLSLLLLFQRFYKKKSAYIFLKSQRLMTFHSCQCCKAIFFTLYIQIPLCIFFLLTLREMGFSPSLTSGNILSTSELLKAFLKYVFLLIVVYFEDLNWDNFVKTEKQIYECKRKCWNELFHFIKCFSLLRTEFLMYS